MSDLFYRTEDIPKDEILNFFVETQQDREVIDLIKAVSPVVVIGSRGVGKSFLLKVAETEMLSDFKTQKNATSLYVFHKKLFNSYRGQGSI